MTDPTTELLKGQLKQLRLPAMVQELEKLSREAAAANQNYEQFLLQLTEIELAARTANALATRIKNAGFPVLKDFDTYDFTALPNLSKPKVLELARGEWIREKFNASLVGSTGTGKTHLAIALGQAACRQGYRVGVLHGGEVGQPTGESPEAVHARSVPDPTGQDGPADLRRVGVRVVQPQWRGAALPGLHRPL